MSIEKIQDGDTEVIKLKGHIEFTLAGYPSVEEWIQNEPEDSVKSLLLDVFEQLK